jgi:hypothetical protein
MPLRHWLDQFIGKFAAEHSGDLGDLLGGGSEPIEPRHQRGMQGRRHRQRGKRGRRQHRGNPNGVARSMRAACSTV